MGWLVETNPLPIAGHYSLSIPLENTSGDDRFHLVWKGKIDLKWGNVML